jgi:hypothetical protein
VYRPGVRIELIWVAACAALVAAMMSGAGGNWKARESGLLR